MPLGIMAFGLGFGMAQRTSLVMSSVPSEHAGNASSILTLSRQVAGAFGIGILSTVLQTSIENHVLSLAQNSLINTASPNVIQEVATLIVLKAQIIGYSTVLGNNVHDCRRSHGFVHKRRKQKRAQRIPHDCSSRMILFSKNALGRNRTCEPKGPGLAIRCNTIMRPGLGSLFKTFIYWVCCFKLLCM